MKIQSPWMGRIKGSAGNMTGCKTYDKNVMRAKAFEVSNPNTAAQQVQRGYFADLIKLVSGFSPEQLRTLFPNKPKAMSRRNALSKQLAEYNTMEGTEKVIDFANIDTLGNAPTAPIEVLGVDNQGDYIDINWHPDTLAQYGQPTDYLCFAIINETKQEMSLTSSVATIDNDTIDVTIPSHWEQEDTINAIPFITDAKEANQDFGSFIIKVRPAKKSN